MTQQTEKEEVADELLKSLKNGVVDLSGLPFLLNAVKEETRAIVLAEMKANADKYDYSIRKYISEKVDQSTDQAVAKLEKEIKDLSKKYSTEQRRLKRQIYSLEQQNSYMSYDLSQRATNYVIILGGLLLCIFFFGFLLATLKSVLFDGVWQGFHLDMISAIAISIAPHHPIWAMFLFIWFVQLAIVLIGGIIWISYFSIKRMFTFIENLY